MSEQSLWPMTFAERASGWLDGTETLQSHHILDYAYQPGSKKRYTAEGWEVWKRVAIREGLALPIEDLGDDWAK